MAYYINNCIKPITMAKNASISCICIPGTQMIPPNWIVKPQFYGSTLKSTPSKQGSFTFQLYIIYVYYICILYYIYTILYPLIDLIAGTASVLGYGMIWTKNYYIQQFFGGMNINLSSCISYLGVNKRESGF